MFAALSELAQAVSSDPTNIFTYQFRSSAV